MHYPLEKAFLKSGPSPRECVSQIFISTEGRTKQMRWHLSVAHLNIKEIYLNPLTEFQEDTIQKIIITASHQSWHFFDLSLLCTVPPTHDYWHPEVNPKGVVLSEGFCVSLWIGIQSDRKITQNCYKMNGISKCASKQHAL